MALLVNNTNGINADYVAKTTVAGGYNLQSNHTLACRIRWTGTTSIEMYNMFWSANANQSGQYMTRQAGDTANLIFGRRYNTIFTTNDSASYGSGSYSGTSAWHHYAQTYDGTNIRTYVDGVLANTTASTASRVSSTTSTNLGIAVAGTCVMADAAFFARAFSADEILRLAGGRLANLMGKGDCFGFYPFHYDSRLKDYSGLGNDLSDVAGTGTAPAADNEGVPAVWTPSRVRMVYVPATVVDLGAGLMATRSGGAAALTKAASLTGAGATRSAGLAAMTKAALLIGTSATRSAGSATDTKAASVIGTSLTRSAGSATESKAFSLTGSGATRSAGLSTASWGASLIGACGTRSAGAATDTKAAAYIGSSLTRSAGTAAQSRTFALTGSSATRSAGQADLSRTHSVIGTMATRSAGAALEAKLAALVGLGNTISRGNADIDTGGLDGLMTTRSAGHADLTVVASITGTGATRSAGAATVSSPSAISGTGATRSAGAATTAKVGSLMASAATRSMQVGTFSITASETASSLTRSGGSATLTVTKSLVGTSETISGGRARFDTGDNGLVGKDDGGAARMRRMIRTTGRRRGR